MNLSYPTDRHWHSTDTPHSSKSETTEVGSPMRNILGWRQGILCACFFFLVRPILFALLLSCFVFTLALQSREPNELKSSQRNRHLKTFIFSCHSNHY